MSKNLNNNYSSDSTTNLQITSLTTNLATLSSSISTLATVSYVDFSVNTSYLQSYTVGNFSISAAITLNNTAYVLPLLSTYMTSILTTSLINSLISTNNTVYIANLLSSTLTSQNTLRDTAISTAISSAKTSYLSSSNTYTANQVFSSITTNIINYVPSFNSINLGTGSIGVNCTSIGSGLSALSCSIVGANTMLLNTGSNNCVLACNSLNNNTTGKNLICIGNSSGSNQTVGNNNCYIGAESNTSGLWSNSCAIGYGSMITQSNQIQLGSSSETVFCNKISAPNNQILTYSTIPSTVSNQVGYQVSNSGTIAISFISNSYINISLCTLPVGIYIVNYSMNLYSTSTTTGVVEKSFVEYGISTTSTSNNIQNKKTYFSVPTSLSHSLTNTICYVSTGLTIFLNATLPSQDLTNNALTASSFYVNNANIKCTRIA